MRLRVPSSASMVGQSSPWLATSSDIISWKRRTNESNPHYLKRMGRRLSNIKPIKSFLFFWRVASEPSFTWTQNRARGPWGFYASCFHRTESSLFCFAFAVCSFFWQTITSFQNHERLLFCSHCLQTFQTGGHF